LDCGVGGLDDHAAGGKREGEAELMLAHHIGVTTAETYGLKEISNDFFNEDEG
jgi:hypothetical protein